MCVFISQKNVYNCLNKKYSIFYKTVNKCKTQMYRG